MDADKEGQIGSRDFWSANLRSSAATSFGCMAMEQGNLKVGLRADGLDLLVNRFERISNRIVLGVIAAAFINGFAVLLSVYHPPGLERWAWAAFALGFGCALLLGIYLAWSILRSR